MLGLVDDDSLPEARTPPSQKSVTTFCSSLGCAVAPVGDLRVRQRLQHRRLVHELEPPADEVDQPAVVRRSRTNGPATPHACSSSRRGRPRRSRPCRRCTISRQIPSGHGRPRDVCEQIHDSRSSSSANGKRLAVARRRTRSRSRALKRSARSTVAGAVVAYEAARRVRHQVDDPVCARKRVRPAADVEDYASQVEPRARSSPGWPRASPARATPTRSSPAASRRCRARRG